MKKSIFKMTLILGAMVLILGSCSKSNDDNPTLPGQLGGSFELVINDIAIANETTEDVGMLDDLISIGNDAGLGIIITKVPRTVGGVTNIGDGDEDGSVTISGENLLNTDGSAEVYFSVSGTITRVSATKVSFQGTCNSFGTTGVYSFSGYAESEAFKII